MAQGDYVEEHQRRYGNRLDHEERTRKRAAREAHRRSSVAQSLHGHKAKLLHTRRYAEKAQMKKRIKEHEQKEVKAKGQPRDSDEAVPTYLLDREKENKAKALSSALKQKRKEKAGKYAVPLPKVRGMAEEEVFKVIKTGKRKQKGWKRMITKGTRPRRTPLRRPLTGREQRRSCRKTSRGSLSRWSASCDRWPCA